MGSESRFWRSAGQGERHLIQELVLSNPVDVILDAKSIPHLDYCKDLPTASSSLKTVSFGGDVLKPRSDHRHIMLTPRQWRSAQALMAFQSSEERSTHGAPVLPPRPGTRGHSVPTGWYLAGGWSQWTSLKGNPRPKENPEEERGRNNGMRVGVGCASLTRGPWMQKAEGCQQQEAEWAVQAPWPTMAPSPCVDAPQRFLPASQAPSLQSKAQPWKDGGQLAQVANGGPPDTSTPDLPLPSPSWVQVNYLPGDSLHP